MAAGCPPSADDVEIEDPARAVADAQRLLEERAADSSAFTGWLLAADLPASLRLDGLHHANVHPDHVDLVLYRNPDLDVGARIWAPDAERRHEDEPTRYPRIFFYRYADDVAESPTNIH